MSSVDTLDCDVLVVGSGAAGLAAAVTAAHHGLRVIVAEKQAHLGGTSAWSGGWLWVPRNPLAIAEGLLEQEQAPERYLRAQLQREELDPRQQTYLEQAPRMIEFFQRHTAVQFYSGSKMPDMRNSEGASSGGRSVCAQPFDGRLLGKWIHKLRPPLDIISLAGLGIAGGADLNHFLNASRSPASAWYVGKRLARHALDWLHVRRGMQLVNGNALVARLLRSALDKQVQLLTSTSVNALLQEHGRILGARLERDGQPLQVNARLGVILACGGFPHDPQRLAQQMPNHTHYSAAPPSNTGDGLRLGEQAGGRVRRDLFQAAALAPISRVPRRDGSHGHFPHLMERAKPGFIAVRNDGRRFTNEADCYHDFIINLFASTPAGQDHSAWLICDHKAQRRYGLGWAKPFPFPTGHYRRQGYLYRGRTLAELAAQCGIDAGQLQQTVERFNGFADQGLDPDFHRGESPYNRAQGEPLQRPNTSLGALRQGPFYAIRLQPGSLGTFAGLATDPLARVLDHANQPIPGLFAVGNDMSSVMDGHYPSGGITLGPGMTFGYLAALALAGQASA